MSLKQLAANRQNARKSTGPRTPAGRAVSKMNALKHGILSREVLVRGLNRPENEDELAALHQRFWDDLQPVGPVEEMLVDQIVTTHWRLRRALTAEAGEIALNVDAGQWQRSRPPEPQMQWVEWSSLGDPVPKMEESATGLRLLERWLGEVRAAVEQAGELTAAALQKLVQRFGGKSNRLTRELEELCLSLVANPEGLAAPALRERNQRRALEVLDRKLTTLSWMKGECEKREQNMEAARQAAAVLPSMDVLDKILRYETKLERQLFRAMVQLERVQRMRLGEVVPAPLSVEVSARA